jgi:hypothetical protein
MAMNNEQLEMGLSSPVPCTLRHQRRRARAQWWFNRMRQVVDRAMDWEAAPPPRPEQIWFPNTYRAVQTAPQNGESEQQHRCE